MTDKLKIVYRARRELLPYARNAMLHDDAQVKQTKAGISSSLLITPLMIFIFPKHSGRNFFLSAWILKNGRALMDGLMSRFLKFRSGLK
ncbi:hypothetical protein [Leclercia adecarboxylata]|uniref:hypothetical protein n=1 Tax=Leclercia adecarboxylata TaxID=83655 RepID=UPI00384FA357